MHQIGFDRVAVFKFGVGEKTHYLILEMFAQGNAILADHKKNIMAIMRKVVRTCCTPLHCGMTLGSRFGYKIYC